MKLSLVRSAPVLAVLLVLLVLPACEKSSEPPEETEQLDPGDVRASPDSAVVGALTALEKGDYGTFPALVGLALTIKPHPERSGPGEYPLLLEADFEKVREILRAAQGSSPRISGAGREAAYELPGHGLLDDELHLIRHRQKWYFIVD